MLTMSAGAWAWMLLPLPGTGSGSHHHDHAQAAGGSALLHWSIMIAAMMFPLLIAPVRVVANRSLWRRRHRAIALYLTGYSVPWLLYGAIAVAALSYLPFATTAAFALAMAAAWQITPWKQRGLRACHRTEPIAPFGWRADADCLRCGVRAAYYCLLSCWALMLPCAAGFGGYWLMPAISAFTFVERTTDRPRPLRFASVLAVAAVVVAAGAASS